jgi:hypothetical protein
VKAQLRDLLAVFGLRRSPVCDCFMSGVLPGQDFPLLKGDAPCRSRSVTTLPVPPCYVGTYDRFNVCLRHLRGEAMQ